MLSTRRQLNAEDGCDSKGFVPVIARGYLAANEREDDLAVQEALQTFLADRLSGGHLH